MVCTVWRILNHISDYGNTPCSSLVLTNVSVKLTTIATTTTTIDQRQIRTSEDIESELTPPTEKSLNIVRLRRPYQFTLPLSIYRTMNISKRKCYCIDIHSFKWKFKPAGALHLSKYIALYVQRKSNRMSTNFNFNFKEHISMSTYIGHEYLH